jgi:CheY-like chemotaxis protein
MNDATPDSPAPPAPVVMVVEDELLIATSLELALESRGYRILGPVATVDEALELLQTTRPDMALIDYRLARTTTEALLPSLDSKHIPVCVLTGYSPAQLPSAYAGCTVLEKPFRLNTLMDALDHLQTV